MWSALGVLAILHCNPWAAQESLWDSWGWDVAMTGRFPCCPLRMIRNIGEAGVPLRG